jgi:hypothetical protein
MQDRNLEEENCYEKEILQDFNVQEGGCEKFCCSGGAFGTSSLMHLALSS